MTKAEQILKGTVGHEYYCPSGIVYVPKETALIAMEKYVEHSLENMADKLLPQKVEKAVLTDYEDWYKLKYGGVVMVSDYCIEQFITGQ